MALKATDFSVAATYDPGDAEVAVFSKETGVDIYEWNEEYAWKPDVLQAASVPQNMQYAVQRLLPVGTLHPPLHGQERLDQFDVLVGQFADARHGGFSFASAGTLASRARFAQEAHPLF